MCKKCKTARQVPSITTVTAYHKMMWCRECKEPRRLSSGWLKCTAPKEHAVERIVDYRLVGKIDEYLVEWKDYPSSQNTWEPEGNLNPSALEDALDLKERKRAETAAKTKISTSQSTTFSISARSTRNSLATARGVDCFSRSNDDNPAGEVARDPQFARMSGFAAAKKRKRIWTIDESTADNDGDGLVNEDNVDGEDDATADAENEVEEVRQHDARVRL